MKISEHERLVQDHYERMTKGFYLQWNPDHFHMGLFEPGEFSRPIKNLKDSAKFEQALIRMIEKIVAPAGIEESHHVVDAGCGVGGTAIHLARTRGCRVTGVNLSRLHLEIADNKINKAGLDELVRLEHADCSRNLPFADATVDVVVNIESARHYSDRKRFLEEVYRILKPGGKIAASDWMTHACLTAGQYENYIRPLCQSWAMSDLESQSSYTRLLLEAGLEVTEFEGFNGKELDNVRILMNQYYCLRVLQFSGMKAPNFMNLLDQIEKLYEIWRNGYLDIRRYCAVKSE